MKEDVENPPGPSVWCWATAARGEGLHVVQDAAATTVLLRRKLETRRNSGGDRRGGNLATLASCFLRNRLNTQRIRRSIETLDVSTGGVSCTMQALTRHADRHLLKDKK